MLATILSHIRNKLTEVGADALLITSPANVRYLSHFSSPEDGRVLVSADEAVLLTDGRYIDQAAQESQLPVEIFTGRWLDHLKDKLGGQSLAVEADHLSYAAFEELREVLGATPVPSKDIVTALRLRKTPSEVDFIREAASLTDRAFTHILGYLRAGVREVDVALELERYLRAEGADKVAFDIIVASGKRSAMPHGTASRKVIEAGDLVTLDFGAVVSGYHADMTRTLAIGQLSDAHERLYYAVLEAQELALNTIKAGMTGAEVDKVARDSLEKDDLGAYFTHSLGHGTGLEIHEGPSLSKLSQVRLEPGMIVTLEPGAYIPGDAGVRIEDLVLITAHGCELLSHSDKELIHL